MVDEYSGTSFEKGKGDDEFLAVEELIKETLAESQLFEKKAPPPPLSPSPATTPAPVAVKPVVAQAPKLTPTPMSKPTAAPTPTPVPKTEQEKYDATFKEYQVGDIVKGTILKVDPSGILVDIKYKADGLISPEELTEQAGEQLKVGQVVDVMIVTLENKEGYVVLSKKQADYEVSWRLAADAFRAKKSLSGKVIQVVRGGLVVDCGGMRGFVPASQVEKKPQETLEKFAGQEIPIKVIEVNRRQGKIVLSHRLAAGEKVKIDNSKLFNELEVGQIRKGKVASLKNFGAFVDLGGVEGLIHLSELSWKRVRHPSELLKVGQELEVFVLGVDKINKKVALGLKELQPDPWAEATKFFKPGQLVKVKILRFAKFGAFAELDHGLEGLIHISELSKAPVQKPEEAVKVGDVVEVKILRVMPDEQRIGLSIKEAQKIREREEAKAATPKPEETPKVTIGDMIAQKEKERAEREAEEIEEIEEEVEEEIEAPLPMAETVTEPIIGEAEPN